MEKEKVITEIKKTIKHKAIIIWYGWLFTIALTATFIALFIISDFKIIYIIFAFIAFFNMPHIFYFWYKKAVKIAIKQMQLQDMSHLWTKEDILYLINYQRKMALLPPKKLKQPKS